jgi:hypothetical protein
MGIIFGGFALPDNTLMSGSQMIEVPTEKAEDIFYSALEIKLPDQRKAFLDRSCQGDAALRAMVEKLLTLQPAAEKTFQEGGVARLPMGELAQFITEVTELVENIDSLAKEDELIRKGTGG